MGNWLARFHDQRTGRRIGSLAAIAAVIAFSLGMASQQRIPAKVVPRQQITPAPALTGTQLAAYPSTNWPTSGGNDLNDRYSTLSQINAANISGLRGVWLTKLRGSGDGTKYSAESQPLEYDGVIYISTGADDVFAISVATGKILWEYHAHITPKVAPVVCCGWDNRGVALGDGLVYIGQLDGYVVALNQLTGRVVWRSHLAVWQDGYTITSAPLYIGGRLYIGVVGAEYGVRAYLAALNASTGRQLWRFYTTAAPHSPGGTTWPHNGSYLHGGASIWNVPAYDPRSGLLYFSTGNAGPDFSGAGRAGENLFAASVVAVHASTGRLAGWYQEVHHDIWDDDNPSEVVLFNATRAGKSIRGIAHPTKEGWLFLLSRASSHGSARKLRPEPGIRIPEVPVPQNGPQKTWPTQPEPQGCCAFTPHGPLSASVVAATLKGIPAVFKTVPHVSASNYYTPPAFNVLTIQREAGTGGDSWAPSSYSPQTQMSYVCSADATNAVIPLNQSHYSLLKYTATTLWTGGPQAGPGTLTGINDISGRAVWQDKFPTACRSGTVTTAGAVVFAGQSTGEFQAYNARSGRLLWSFQTGAGAADTPAVFDYDGEEYVAFLAGGNLAYSYTYNPNFPGDNLWLFALNGKLGPVAAPKPPPK